MPNCRALWQVPIGLAFPSPALGVRSRPHTEERDSMLTFEPRWIDRIARLCTDAVRVEITPVLSNKLHESMTKRHAAVLVPLCNMQGEASLLYTLRSSNVGTHKGEVSFPGGHQDNAETAVETAIREFYEELYHDKPELRLITSCSNQNALEPSVSKYDTPLLKILGICQTIPAKNGTLVTPVIAYYRNPLEDLSSEFSPNPPEVDAVFTRRIEDLTSPDFIEYEMLERQGHKFRFPAYGSKTEYKIWGLTAIITQGVINNIIVPSMDSATQTPS